jgi:hypothetical protein
MNGADISVNLFLGVVASIALEGIKNYFGADTIWSRTAVVLLSIALGAGYWLIKHNPAWYGNIVSVLGAASMFYGLIIARKPSIAVSK